MAMESDHRTAGAPPGTGPRDTDALRNLSGDNAAELSAIYDAIPVPTMLLDGDRRVIRANRRALFFVGQSETEIMGLSGGEAMRCVHAAASQGGCGQGVNCETCAIHLCIQDSLEHGTIHQGQPTTLEASTPQGARSLHLLVSTTPVTLDGRTFALVSLQDVTTHQQTQLALQESEARWRSLIESTPDTVVLLDRHLRILYTNRPAPGLTLEDLRGSSILEFLPAPQISGVAQTLQGVLTSGTPARYETTWDGPEGKMHFDSHAGPRWARGNIVGITLLARDITVQHQLRAELQERQQRLRSLIDSAEDVFLLVDPDGALIECNAAFERATGKPRRELLGREALDTMAPDVAATRRSVAQQVVATGEPARHRDRRDGRVFDSGLYPVLGELGQVEQLVVHARDVTELLALQAQVSEADRLSSIGLLAAGVAHEVNNPLAYILLNLHEIQEQLAAMGLGPDSELPTMLEDATAGVFRVRDIVRDLETFSKSSATAPTEVDLTQAVTRALDMARNETRFRARVVTDLQAPSIVADTTKLTQVVLNLVVNAAHAIPEGDVASNTIEIHTWEEQGYVHITVSDTGEGIEPELLPKLFEPFFTTKQVGTGSGLGLSICDNIVSAMGGDIQVQSTRGVGTRIQVRLPKVEPGTAQVAPPAAAAPAAPLRRGRIMIVDDEPQVGRSLRRLAERSHDVLLCTSGREAIALLENDQRFDLILSDLMMPEVTGMDLHDWVGRHHPALARRMVFMTGGAFTPRAAAFMERTEAPTLLKPFGHAEFNAVLAELVGSDDA